MCDSVGVEVNTASKELLSYVSGLGPGLAKNIVDYRNTAANFAKAMPPERKSPHTLSEGGVCGLFCSSAGNPASGTRA